MHEYLYNTFWRAVTRAQDWSSQRIILQEQRTSRLSKRRCCRWPSRTRFLRKTRKSCSRTFTRTSRVSLSFVACASSCCNNLSHLNLWVTYSHHCIIIIPLHFSNITVTDTSIRLLRLPKCGCSLHVGKNIEWLEITTGFVIALDPWLVDFSPCSTSCVTSPIQWVVDPPRRKGIEHAQ